LLRFRLKQNDKLSLTVAHQIQKNEHRRVDVYFSLPKEMSINKKTLSESEYFNTGIKGRRAYYTKGLHLPLLHTRFVSRMKRSVDEYKTNLNLFAYQYVSALEIDVNALLHEKIEMKEFFLSAKAIASQCVTILKKHRTNIPTDTKLLAIYENVDNYLSWHTEQSLLKLLAQKARSNEFSDQRIAILDICSAENKYRFDKAYNSPATRDDPNRIANKMRLLRRLIEFAVIFKSNVHELGNIQRKMATGIATALIMSVVLVLIIKTQGAFNTLNALMIFILAIIYGVREVFKDDFKNMLWRWIRKGKPKWSRTLIDSMTQKHIASQKIWVDYIKPKDLPDQVIDLLSRRHSQNKQSAEILHYRLECEVGNLGFQAGYESIEETLVFSIRPFSRYLEKGVDKVYAQQLGSKREKIQTTSIDRRYQINVVIAVNQGYYTEQFERYRITMNKSEIIAIRRSGVSKAKKKSEYRSETKLAKLLKIVKRIK
jgi:hypothetical protein